MSDKVLQKLTEHDKRFDKHDKDFAFMHQKFEEHDKKFEDHDKQFVAIDKRFDDVDKRFDSVDNRLEAIAFKIVEHDDRLERIENTMATKDDINEIMNRLDDIVVIVQSNSQYIHALKQKIGLI